MDNEVVFPPFTNQAAWSSGKAQDVKSEDLFFFFFSEAQMKLKVITRISNKSASAQREERMSV